MADPSSDQEKREWELKTLRDMGAEPIFVRRPGMVILATGRAGANPDPSLEEMHAAWKAVGLEPNFLNNDDGSAPCVVLFSAKLRGLKLADAMVRVARGLKRESLHVKEEAAKADTDDDDDADDGAKFGPR